MWLHWGLWTTCLSWPEWAVSAHLKYASLNNALDVVFSEHTVLQF